MFATGMRDKIVLQAAELFLNFGFKSVTMDDIASKMGISKKTIYQYFQNKTALVEATTLHLFELISFGIDGICALEKNPVDEIYAIKQFVMKHLKNEKSSPQYQLQKYYPKIFNSLKDKQFCVMNDCVTSNLKRGVSLGLYRKDIDIDFIARLYFSSMLQLKNIELFPPEQFHMKHIMENFLEYHLRGICTETGIQSLNHYFHKTKLNEN